MAIEIPLFLPGVFEAGADLSTHQFKFVKLDSAGRVVVCAAVTDKPVGILQDKPSRAGEAANVMVAGVSKLSADANLAIGDAVGTSADGQGAAYLAGTDTTKYIVGTVLAPDNTAAGGLVSLLFSCLNPARGT